MNLNTVKKLIQEKINIPCKFIYRGPRNQIEEFEGIITKCFPSIFVVLTTDNVTKAFTYNDFIIKNIKILS